MSAFSFVHYAPADDGVATLTLHRPERRNAIHQAMYEELCAALRVADADEATRALVLTGAKGYFTAGNDLTDFVGFTRRDGCELPAHTFLKAIESFRKPIVAAVERGAVGIGVTMLQYCDFVYAGRSTKFAMPFANFGLCPEGGATRLLAHGPMARAAQRWLLLGEPFGPQEALAAQLITDIVEDDTTLAHAQRTASRLAALNPDATQTTKALIRAARPGMQATFAEEIKEFTRLLESAPSQAAIRAFIARK